MNIFVGLLTQTATGRGQVNLNGALKAPYERTFHIYAPSRNSFVQGWETKGQMAFTQPWNHDIITWWTQSTEEPTAEDQCCTTEKFAVFRFSYHVTYRQVSQKGSNKFPSAVTPHDPFTQFKLAIILISYFSKHRK